MKQITLVLFGFFGLLVLVMPFLPSSLSVKEPVVVKTVQKGDVSFKVTNAFEVPRMEVAKAQIPDSTSTSSVSSSSLGDIIKNNWGALLFAFLALVEIVIRATPTLSDNSIFNLIKKLIDAVVPNKNTNGGVYR
jgi:hypothetical protein